MKQLMKYKSHIFSKSIIYSTILGMCSLLVACSSEKPSPTQDEGKMKIVSTIFPIYDWVSVLTTKSEDVQNSYLLDSGMDLHNFQPTAADITAILSSDLFIYVGGESDDWVQDVLKQDTNGTLRTINLLEVLEDLAKEEEYVEGMQIEEGHDHDADHEDHDHEEAENHEATSEEGHAHEMEYDEHIWMSLRYAQVICDEITTVLSQIDAGQAAIYEKNKDDYVKALNQVDKQYEEMLGQMPYSTLIVADRFPYRYLTDDYGLAYSAAFAGCSAEVEASFETIIFLANRLNETQVPAVIVTEASDQKIAKTVIQNTKEGTQRILVLNSLQSVSQKEAQNLSYLTVMEENLSVLIQALGGGSQ